MRAPDPSLPPELRRRHVRLHTGCRWLLAVVAATLLAQADPVPESPGGPDYERLEGLAEQRYGEVAAATVRAWRELVAAGSNASEAEKLRLANVFFNDRVAFRTDLEVWGERDYWATPLEVMGRGAGDCEDFSVAKYITLLLLDVPMDKLRLVYVKAAIGGAGSRVTQAHMVVAYYEDPGAAPLILDNLVEEIRPAPRRPDLTPVFSFNSAGLWVGGSARPADTRPERRLSRWRDVLARMQDEGIR